MFLILVLLIATSVFAGEEGKGINIQIIQDSQGASILNPSGRVDTLGGLNSILPRQGITGIHYLKNRKETYFRGTILVQDDTDPQVITFLYQPNPKSEQLNKLVINKQDIIHLTTKTHAIAFANGVPLKQPVGLWESRTNKKPSWSLLGASLLGIGMAAIIQEKQLNHLERPYDYTYNHEAYRHYNEQKLSRDRQKKALKIGGAGFLIMGAVSIIEGMATYPQVILGDGTKLEYTYSPASSQNYLALTVSLNQ